MNEAASELLDAVEIPGRSDLAEALYGVTMYYNLVQPLRRDGLCHSKRYKR